MQRLLTVLVGLATLGVLEALFFLLRSARRKTDEELRRRLRSLTASTGNVHLLRQGRLAKSASLDALLRRFPAMLRLETLLERADVQINVARLGAVSLLIGAAAGVGAWSLRPLALLAILCALVGAGAPFLWLAIVIQRRSQKLSEQLPDGLDMMARSLRAGHALSTSFRVLATELPAPISVEFARAAESQNLGVSLERAILQMVERAPSNRDLKIFAVSVIVQRETGGNLAEILGGIADTIRARYRFFGKLRALTAEGRASGFVLAALPVAMTAFLLATNPTYLQTLAVDPLGRLIAAYAAVSWVVGLLWMNRMTKMEI